MDAHSDIVASSFQVSRVKMVVLRPCGELFLSRAARAVNGFEFSGVCTTILCRWSMDDHALQLTTDADYVVVHHNVACIALARIFELLDGIYNAMGIFESSKIGSK